MNRWSLIATLVVAACSGLAPEAPQAELKQVLSADGDAVPIPAELQPSERRIQLAGGPAAIYFLNFDGVTIKPGGNDARSNSSYIGAGGTVPAFAGTSAERDEILAWVRNAYAGMNIEFVTSRPPSGSYAMIVVGGRPADIALNAGSGTTGIAPLDCGNKFANDVGFAFSARTRDIRGNYDFAASVGQTIAHEAGHTLGLPHTGDGCDIMSYSGCLSSKSFLDRLISMQADGNGKCGFTEINTHSQLLSVLGAENTTNPPNPPNPGNADTQRPSVTISSPSAQATVPENVTISGTVTDDTGVTRIELRVDNVLVASRQSGPFQGTLFDVQLAVGTRELRITAFDAAGNQGSASTTLTVEASASSDPPADPINPSDPKNSAATDPAPGSSAPADDTTSSPPDTTPARGTYGAPCERPEDCNSNLCAGTYGGTRYCTDNCTPGVTRCGIQGECLPTTTDSYVCGPPLQATTHGATANNALVGNCSLSRPASATPVLLTLIGMFLLGWRRRRQESDRRRPEEP